MTNPLVYLKLLAGLTTSWKNHPIATRAPRQSSSDRACSGRGSRLVAALALFWVGMPSAVFAGRSWLYLPLPAEAGEPALTTNASAAATAGMRRATPDLVTEGIDDPAWRRYVAVWQAHHFDPDDPAIRRFLGLPADRVTAVTVRPGRVSPNFLPWRRGQFLVAQSEHFQILARADAATVRQLAVELERIYWGWTQAFFPLWSHRGEVDRLLDRWSADPEQAAEMLQRRGARCRLEFSDRHRVVLFRDAEEYQRTLSRGRLAGNGQTALASSTGFYSTDLETAFLYTEADRASRVHEIAHQLFYEATGRSGRRDRSSSARGETARFWLLEGIAGFCESFRHDGRLATIGGWDSPRLQAARYRSVIGRRPVLAENELAGTRRHVQRRGDLAEWYSQSILRTHALMEGSPQTRAAVIAALADLYDVQLEGSNRDGSLAIGPQEVERFLRVDDAELKRDPVHIPPTEVCLAGCEVTSSGLETLPPLSSLRWLDLSRLPIGNADVLRLVPRPASLRQLSLEATRISSDLSGWLAGCSGLRELDLSWTTIGDKAVRGVVEAKIEPPNRLSRATDASSIAGPFNHSEDGREASSRLKPIGEKPIGEGGESFGDDSNSLNSRSHRRGADPISDRHLVTIWLTGTQITDQAVETLRRLPDLQTLDVQRTAVTERGRRRLMARFPDLTLDPLQFAAE